MGSLSLSALTMFQGPVSRAEFSSSLMCWRIQGRWRSSNPVGITPPREEGLTFGFPKYPRPLLPSGYGRQGYHLCVQGTDLEPGPGAVLYLCLLRTAYVGRESQPPAPCLWGGLTRWPRAGGSPLGKSELERACPRSCGTQLSRTCH